MEQIFLNSDSTSCVFALLYNKKMLACRKILLANFLSPNPAVWIHQVDWFWIWTSLGYHFLERNKNIKTCADGKCNGKSY